MNENVDVQHNAPHTISDVYRDTRLAYAESSAGDKGMLAIALGGVAFEWSTGNETLLGLVGGHTHRVTEDPALTGIVTGGTSFVEQFLLGTTMAAAIGRFPRLTTSIRRLVSSARDYAAETDKRTSKVSRFLSAFVLGAAVDVAVNNSTQEHSRKDNQKRVAASAAMVGVAVAGIGTAGSGALRLGTEYGYEAQAQTAVNVITSPWTYLGLFAASLGYSKVKKFLAGRRKNGPGTDTGRGDIGDVASEHELHERGNPKTVDFDTYRSLCDQESGLMRVGLTVPSLFDNVRDHSQTQHIDVNGAKFPVIASVDPFHIPEDGEVPEVTKARSALVPVTVLPRESRHDLLVTRQFLLDEKDADKIVSPSQDLRLKIEDILNIYNGKIEGDLVQGHGEPQFTILSRYDVSDCEDFRTRAPSEVITKSGHVLTTDKNVILENLQELVGLQEEVFKQQAVQIGYYDGMVGDIIERFLREDAFIGAAAFDKDTGKPIMFALFAAGLDGLGQIPWLNKELAETLIREYDDSENPTFALPIVITAKFSGLGIFDEVVPLAMHEIIYRTQEQKQLHALYNANLQSVLYTPRIINSAAKSSGASHIESLIEVSVTTRLP